MSALFDFYRATPHERASHEASKRDERAEFLAEEFRIAWLEGRERVESVCGTETLADAISGDLCDLPGNQLHSLIALVRKYAKQGDSQAMAIVEAMGKERGLAVAELEYDRGLIE